MLSLLLLAALTASDVAPWRAQAEQLERSSDWCAAWSYRARVLERPEHTPDDVYRAFLAAYGADQLKTASALYPQMALDELGLSPDAARKLAHIKADLDTVSPLEDATCPTPPSDTSASAPATTPPAPATPAEQPAPTSRALTSAATLVPPILSAPAATTSSHPSAPTSSHPSSLTSSHTSPSPSQGPASGAERPRGVSPFLVGGGIASGAGLLTVGVGGALALSNDHTIATPSATGAEKQDAVAGRTAGWVALGFGSAAVVAGGVALAIAWSGEP